MDGLASGSAWHLSETRTLTWSVSIDGAAPDGVTQQSLINNLTPIFAAWSQVADIQFQAVAADSAATSPADIATDTGSRRGAQKISSTQRTTLFSP